MRLLLALLLIGLAGCTHRAVYPASNIAKAHLTTKHCNDDEDCSELTEPVAPLSPPRNVLVLSGGGMYGAFSAGVLAGWTESQRRPEFDVVTGVSTGSLIGLAAFLGPKYDPIAREFYTLTKASDVYNFRAWVLIPWSDSLASSKPLKKLLESVVTEKLLASVAREHRKGRRFYVGTTHLESRKFTVWDMGAIANRGELQRFRDVILASCSVPGILPPVRIVSEVNGQKVSELHVDGGTTAALFVPPGLIAAAPNGGPSGTNVYVIVAGKLFADPGDVRTRVLPVMGASANSLLYASARSEIATIHHLCRLAGANFHLAAVPGSDRVNADGLIFDTQEMTRLYETGTIKGISGPEWMTSPPFESSATEAVRE